MFTAHNDVPMTPVGTLLKYRIARWYEPGVGRYTRADPLGLLADINFYAYVRGNPLRWFDPLGLRKVCCEKTVEELLELAQEASNEVPAEPWRGGNEDRP